MPSLIEGSDCEHAGVEIRLLHEDSRLAEIFSNHTHLIRSVLNVTIYTFDSSFTSVCTVQSLAAHGSRDGLTPPSFGHLAALFQSVRAFSTQLVSMSITV